MEILNLLDERKACLPNTPYSIAKFFCTNILLELYKKEKFPVTIFRLFQVYGPNKMIIGLYLF